VVYSSPDTWQKKRISDCGSSVSFYTQFRVSRTVCGAQFRLLAPGPRDCFRSECCTGGESVAASRMNSSFHLKTTSTTSPSRPQFPFMNVMTRPAIEPYLPV